MRALYAGARQAEALEAYRSVRELLDEELALDPSPQLRNLEQAILRQDDTLELPAAATVSVGVAAPAAASVLDQPPRRRERPPARASNFAGWLLPLPFSQPDRPPPASSSPCGYRTAQACRPSPPRARSPSSTPAPGGSSDRFRPDRRSGQSASVQARSGTLRNPGSTLEVDRRSLRLIRQVPRGAVDWRFRGWQERRLDGQHRVLDVASSRSELRAHRRPDPTMAAVRQAGHRRNLFGLVWLWRRGRCGFAHGLAHVERVDPATGRIEHSFSF